MAISGNWFTSSFSNGGGCVQVSLGDDIQVRDSKDPSGPVLHFNRREWNAFLAGVRAGEFELPALDIDLQGLSAESI